MTDKPYLTTEYLVQEYETWGSASRNSHDLRFGQAIHIKYSHVPAVAFNIEDKAVAFNQLLAALKEYQR